jgi:hypothetical protein
MQQPELRSLMQYSKTWATAQGNIIDKVKEKVTSVCNSKNAEVSSAKNITESFNKKNSARQENCELGNKLCQIFYPLSALVLTHPLYLSIIPKQTAPHTFNTVIEDIDSKLKTLTVVWHWQCWHWQCYDIDSANFKMVLSADLEYIMIW